MVDSASHAERPMPYVCCAAGDTYGTGALPVGIHEDAPGAATTDPESFGIRKIEQMFETARYHWRFPDSGFVNPSSFTDDLAAFYTSLATQNCPASMLVCLTDAVLSGSVLYARASSNPAIVYETHRPNDRPAVQLLGVDQIAAADKERFSDKNWRNVFIGSAGSSNYGHWLVDDLPRLKAMHALMRLADRPVRILIHSYGEKIDQMRMQSIRLLLGQAVHIDLLDAFTPYHFDELFYVTPNSYHPVQKSPVAIDFAVYETVSRVLANVAPPPTPSLLFVDRAPEHGRTLANYDAIRAMAEARGFATIDPAGMSFAEQVRIFAGAQVVIGQMGAAMTNTLFCRPSTTLIYLAPTGWIEPFYWDLSVVRGHYYRVIYGDVTDTTVAAHRSNFTIDPTMLQNSIDLL